jgi:hypothetical protein
VQLAFNCDASMIRSWKLRHRLSLFSAARVTSLVGRRSLRLESGASFAGWRWDDRRKKLD